MSNQTACSWCGREYEENYPYCQDKDCPFLETAMGKRLSDDPGLTEMKRREYLMSKAPCLARLNDLAAYAAKDDDDVQPKT